MHRRVEFIQKQSLSIQPKDKRTDKYKLLCRSDSLVGSTVSYASCAQASLEVLAYLYIINCVISD